MQDIYIYEEINKTFDILKSTDIVQSNYCDNLLIIMISMPKSYLTDVDVRYTRRESEQLENFSTRVITDQLIYSNGYIKHEIEFIANEFNRLNFFSTLLLLHAVFSQSILPIIFCYSSSCISYCTFPFLLQNH